MFTMENLSAKISWPNTAFQQPCEKSKGHNFKLIAFIFILGWNMYILSIKGRILLELLEQYCKEKRIKICGN